MSTTDFAGDAARAAGLPLGYARLARFVSGSRARWRIAALGLILSLPAAGMGLMADDYDLAAAVADDPLSAYAFQPRDPALRRASLTAARAAGQMPWWTDENFHQAFMRPLSSLSFAFDFALWPRAAWWMHVENSLLFACCVLLVGALYRTILRDEVAAGLATFFFATNPALAASVGWLSGRNTLLAATFGLLCLWLQQRAMQAVQRAGLFRLGAAAAFLCSLLSAEVGLSTLAYLAACGITLDTGSWRARLVRLVPYLLIAITWRGVYRWAGFGVVGSTFYRDPLADPRGFAWNLATGIPTYLASQLTWPFASLSAFSSQIQLAVAALSLLLLALLRPLFWPLLRDDVRARFFALGALLATLPLGATLPQDRLAFFVAFGVGGVLAQCVCERFAGAGSPHVRAVQLFRVRAFLTPLGFVPALFVACGLAAGGGAVVLDRALRVEHEPVVLINAPTALPVHHRRMMRKFETGEAVPPVDLLYAGIEPVSVRRVAERALELRVEGGFLRSPVSGAVRDPRRTPLRAGDIIELPRMRVRVLAARAGDPVWVRFELHADASGRAPRVYAWEGREPRAWRRPALGEWVELPGLSLL